MPGFSPELHLRLHLAGNALLGHDNAGMGQEVNINGCLVVARSSGVLWWPAERLLCVSDLHLGKSERMARRSAALLPPYETTETLARLSAEIADLDPVRVVCLGDSFDDDACIAALASADRSRLLAMAQNRDWIWIAGNHDRGTAAPGGRCAAEFEVGGLVFRHEALVHATPGEISGHFHPKIRIRARGVTIVRRCFVTDGARLMLPAFGAYTGGLWCDHPAIDALFSGNARAILTGAPCMAVPLRLAAMASAR